MIARAGKKGEIVSQIVSQIVSKGLVVGEGAKRFMCYCAMSGGREKKLSFF